jgi:hypothetical protein
MTEAYAPGRRLSILNETRTKFSLYRLFQAKACPTNFRLDSKTNRALPVRGGLFSRITSQLLGLLVSSQRKPFASSSLASRMQL